MNAGVLRGYAQLFPAQLTSSGSYRQLIRNTGLLVASAAVLIWVPHRFMNSPGLGALFLCLAMLVLLVMWCGAFAAGAVRQNQPAYACLVPQLHRRLTICCVLLSVVTSVALAVTISVSFGYAGHWLALTGLLIPFLLLMQRFPIAMSAPAIFWVASKLVPGAWIDTLAAPLLSLGEPALWLLCLATDIAAMAFALKVALPRGGDRHFAGQGRLDSWLKTGKEGYAPGASQQGASWRVLYTGALRGYSARSTQRGGEMLRALGLGGHDGAALVSTIVIAVVPIALSMKKAGDLDLFPALKIGYPVPSAVLLLLVVQSFTTVLLSAVGSRTGEQELYRFSAGAPASRDFNRVLATALLRRFARIWLLVLVAMMCIDCVVTRSLAPRAYSLAQASLALPFACMLVRDYARMRAVPGGARAVVMAIALIAASSAFAGIAEKYAGFPWLVPALLIAAGSLFTLRSRWQSMMKAAPPFPAGRLAD